MFGYNFQHTWVLTILILVLPAYLALSIRARKRSLIPYPPIQYQPGHILPKLTFSFHIFIESLLVFFLILSLAKPYKSTEFVSIEEKGIDILLVVDVSSSMQAKDFDPNRLEATKKILKDFIRRSSGHRIGIVVFGKHVFTLSSITTDHLVLQNLVDGLGFETIDHVVSGGTAIGDAILRGTEIINRVKIPGRDQIMILLTDGDNNMGIDNDLATKYALEKNIKIYTIGIGSTEEITIAPDPKNPNWTFPTKLVEEPLIQIANQTNGRYFHAVNNDILDDIFNDISKLEQTPLEIERVQQKKFMRYPLNVVIFTLFILSIFIRVLFLRRPLK